MEKAEKKMEKAVANLSYLKQVFGTEQGKDCLYELCKQFHYFSSSYQGDVNDTIFREGERNVLNFIMNRLEQSPKKIMDDFRQRLQEEKNGFY